MRIRLFALALLMAAPLAAQEWRVFGRGAVFGAYVTETGPAQPRNQFFSTNWFEGHAERSFGKSSVDFHGRVTAEPFTIPEEGYPQLLQPGDRMPAHDLVEDAGVRFWWRALRVDAALAAAPPLGAEPYRQRISSIDFPQAPFSYDVAESFKSATRLAGLAIDTRPLVVESAVFHAAQSTGRHTTLDNGPIDSWSGRVTLRPHDAVALQLSHGKLGDAKLPVTSASATWSGKRLAAAALWTKRDQDSAYGAEAALRGRRHTVMARVESIERRHVSLAYIFDLVKRVGIGIAGDYHPATHDIRTQYGHKPQSFYVFMRARTE
jgi:hypothetical protein